LQGNDLGFTAIDLLNKDNTPYLSIPPTGTTINSRWNLRSPNIELKFQTASTDTGSEDDYLISKPINLVGSVQNTVVPIKDVRERFTSFTHRYRTPGAYRVVFIARDFRDGKIHEKVANVDIVIEE